MNYDFYMFDYKTEMKKSKKYFQLSELKEKLELAKQKGLLDVVKKIEKKISKLK